MQFTYYKKRETWMVNNNIQLYSIEGNSTETMWYNVHHQTGINFLKFDNSKGWGGCAEMRFNMATHILELKYCWTEGEMEKPLQRAIWQ